jgi:hypothetical protein
VFGRDHPGKAFWVETHGPQEAVATLRAFTDGGYSGTWWYDSTGRVWTVVEEGRGLRESSPC